jgi:HD-GYP domain-containing protein (c-di-GMP phosphodiesterase class II)
LKSKFPTSFNLDSMRVRVALVVGVWVVYGLAFAPIYSEMGDAVGTFVTLPVMATAWLLGMRGGLAGALLNIPLNALLFFSVGQSGWDVMFKRWPGMCAGLLIGVVIGWLSDLFRKVRIQSMELAVERDALQKEIAERQRAEQALRRGRDELEIRVQERTAELILVNEALQADLAALQRAEERISRQVSHLSALRAIDSAISSNFDLRVTFNTLLGHAISELGVDAAVVLSYDRGLNELKFAAARGFRGNAVTRLRLRVGENYAGQAVLERRLIYIPDLNRIEVQLPLSPLLAKEDFVSLFAVPLIAKGEIKGVLEIFHRALLAPDEEWYNFLESLAGQSAIAMDNAELFENLQRSNFDLRLAYDKTIEGWSHALDLRDKETEGHTLRVTGMTLELALRMGISEDELTHIRRGALLHDIGKMGVPDVILLKAESLTEDESAIMRRHPQYAYDMLAPIDFLRASLDIPYCHHEKWDSTGYPRGLKGEAIPMAARIFAVVDVWDALCSNRPYRPAWTKEKALEHIKSLTGMDFDPKVVQAFIELHEAG